MTSHDRSEQTGSERRERQDRRPEKGGADPEARLLGRYLIQGELGRGSMGRVLLLAEDTAAGSAGSMPLPDTAPRAPATPLVACKVLERPELRADFLREFELLRRLAHPALPTPLRLVARPRLPSGLASDARPPDLLAFMERVDGQPLDPAQAPPGALLPRLAWQLLSALDHLHRSGFVHGDLAPPNVLWAASGALRLLDLGAGGAMGSRAGKTSGVLAYAAPERLEGAPLSAASDLWSAGALLFGAAHGRHPYPGYPASRHAAPDHGHLTASPLDPWLDRLLSRPPADRHPSAAAALAELESLFPEAPLRQWPATPHAFVDAGERVAEIAAELARHGREGRPAHVDLAGPPGSGKSRTLIELLERLAVLGLPGLEIPAGDRRGESWVRAALAALGAPDDPSGRLTSLARAVASTGGPVVLAADDLASAPALRALLGRLTRAMSAVPERFPGLVLITVGLGEAALEASTQLPIWTVDDARQALELRFPGRRVGARDLEALIEASRGRPGLFWALVDHALAAHRLRVDSAQLAFEPDALGTAPASLDAAAHAALARLSPAGQDAAAILAWAQLPVPRLDASEELLAAGLALHEARGLRLSSDALVAAARPHVPRALADRALAAIYAAHGQAALALAHRIACGDAAPTEADATLPALDSRAPATRVLMEVLAQSARADGLADPVGPTWPTDAHTALVAANLADQLGNLEAALDLHKRGMALARHEGSPERFARAALGLGRLESRAARYPQALEAFRAALPSADRSTDLSGAIDPELEVLLLSGLARAAALSGELETAQEAAERGLALARGAEPGAEPDGAGPSDPTSATHASPSALAGLLYTRALVDWYRGRLDEAEPRLTRALEAARVQPARSMAPAQDGPEAARQATPTTGIDAGDEAAITTALGLVAHRRGDHARAARYYSEALRLGEAARDEARVLTVLQNQAVLQHERGEWTEALDTYRHALSLAEGLDARARIAQLAGNLGNLWRYLGETDRAEAVLERGLAIARADKNRHLDAVITNLLGDVASDRGDLAKAEALFREAVAIARDAQCRPEAIEASLNLARVLIERFDIRAARELVEETLAATEAEAHRPMQIISLALLATIERRSSHESTRAGGPSQLIDAALAGIESIKNADARWPIYLEAALAARDRDDLSAAENWAREVRKVLQGQLDQVPAAHRERFKARRDRRDAHRETASLATLSNSAARHDDRPARALGWTRLLEVHKRLAQEHNVQRLLEYILDSAILLTGAERGFLLLDDESHKEGLEVRVARNLDQENIRNKHMKISRGIARRVIATGEAVVTVDAMEDERYREQLSVVDLRLRSILCLPMAFRGKVLGAIYLDNRFRASAFSDEDLRFMEAFADMAAIALDNARLVESLESQKKATDLAKREVESLASRLETELERRTRELEDTRIMMIAERRQLAEHRFDDIIGTSAPMRRVFQMIERLRNTDIAVLVEGESGTGKELVARAIHFSGSRRERPFVAVNCGAIPAALLESELFGHVRGAFTNATSDKKGLFEVAHTGTLFLDEIGEMPLEMQVKLLRVLQSGDIQKVGAVKQVTVDVRIVTATNRKLDEEVAAGRFREDLFYRLSVVPIVVPPLRDRRDDIPLLVQHFIEANKKSGLGQVQSISKDALALLQRYTWPGNVRQLETVMKNASVFCDGTVLYPQDFSSFPDIIGGSGGPGGTTPNDKTDATALSLSGRTLADLERLAIVQALKDMKGNKKKTAEQLGIDRRTLYNKLASYGIAIESDLKVT